jgi:acyl carrier protein
MCSPSFLDPIRLPRQVGFANTSPRMKQAIEAIMEDIAKAVQHFILREFLRGEDPNELTFGTPLITGGILDSISTLKLVVFLEEHFGITIEAFEAGVEHLDSIGQIAELVSRKKKSAA